MSSTYLTGHGPRHATQGQPIPGRTDQIQNASGAYVFEVGDWDRLERFLVLGSEGGTFYVGERELTADNAKVVYRCLADDGLKLVDKIVEISVAGRAPKNDPAIFALVLAASDPKVEVRQAALGALDKVCRTATHLFMFLEILKGFRGQGRAVNRAVGEWYTGKDVEQLAYQLIKYRSRNGWTHRDVLRKAKPAAGQDNPMSSLLGWAVGKGEWTGQADPKLDGRPMPHLVKGFQAAQAAETPQVTAALIRSFPGLPREALKNEHLADPDVWRALLDNGMPLTALIRNLGKLTSVGVLEQMGGSYSTLVAEQLVSEEALAKARIHPIALLNALLVYKGGHGIRGSLSWNPVGKIVDALDAAFYKAFGFVEPTGKNTMLAIDVSGSMAWPSARIAAMPSMFAREASAAMALVTAAVEPNYMITTFSNGLESQPITPRQRLDDVVNQIRNLPASYTDCALPITAALQQKLPVETFVIYTDNETNSTYSLQPSVALKQYREKTGIDAKMIVVGMAANNASIADPQDPNRMLDVVGFDTATPALISSFSAG